MTPLPCSHHLNRSVVANIETYGYHDSDIVVMTDEEENKNTKRWPSKENIVSLSLNRCSRSYPLQVNPNFRNRPWSTSRPTHLAKMRSSSTVSFCVALPSLVDHIR